jgi:hypothetical protein
MAYDNAAGGRSLLKKIRITILMMVLLLGIKAYADSPDRAPDVRQAGAPNQIEPGVFDVLVIVSDPQDSRREEYRRIFHNAQRRLLAFAKANGWANLMNESFVKQVEIYDSKVAFDRRLCELDLQARNAAIPKTFVAAVENGSLLVVSPEVLNDNVPEARSLPDAYEKLMVHELAHRLHIRVCHGDENRMGPIWFWEGFATYAADQYPGNKPLADNEMWQVINAKQRGSYKKYNAVFTQLLKQTGCNLSDYVAHAGESDFVEWLKQNRH